MSKSKSTYFPNLNGLRAIAAFLVVIHHTEQIKKMFGLNNLIDMHFFYIIGKLGLVLFFVLSGFLITHLLLVEQKTTKKINVKNFYIRRILRIWPLYYTIIFFSYFILPNISLFDIPGVKIEPSFFYFKTLLLYIFMLPNLVLSNFAFIPYASQTWSIGTEEQFYLIWPILFILGGKNKLLIMLGVIVSYYCIKYYLSFNPKNILNIDLLAFVDTLRMDCMAIGGVFAVLNFQKSRFLKYFNNNSMFYISTLASIALMIKAPYFISANNTLYPLLFGIIILNLSTNKKLTNILENKICNYLGRISYGIYMYHSIIIVLAIRISIYLETTLPIYPIIITITILLSAVSYKYIEEPLLKKKKKFI